MGLTWAARIAGINAAKAATTVRLYIMVTERSDSVIIHNLSPACAVST